MTIDLFASADVVLFDLDDTIVDFHGCAEPSWRAVCRMASGRAHGLDADELYDAIVDGKAPLHDGPWAMATLDVMLAMLRSAREGREIELS